MHQRILATGLLLLAAPAAAAPDPAERTAVLAAVQSLFGAIHSADRAALEDIMLPEANANVMLATEDGWRLQSRSRTGLGDMISKPGPPLREQIYNPTVLIEGPLAVVWAKYSFAVGDKLSHCGIDVFDLVKTNGTWKIGNAMWTIEPDGCA